METTVNSKWFYTSTQFECDHLAAMVKRTYNHFSAGVLVVFVPVNKYQTSTIVVKLKLLWFKEMWFEPIQALMLQDDITTTVSLILG